MNGDGDADGLLLQEAWRWHPQDGIELVGVLLELISRTAGGLTRQLRRYALIKPSIDDLGREFEPVVGREPGYHRPPGLSAG